jgi:hypothetical protein
MTRRQLNARRAVIVRRWAAYLGGRAQREIWKKRRAAEEETTDETYEGSSEDGDLLAGFPRDLLG